LSQTFLIQLQTHVRKQLFCNNCVFVNEIEISVLNGLSLCRMCMTCCALRTKILMSWTPVTLRTVKNCTLLLMRTMNMTVMTCATCRLMTVLSQLIMRMMLSTNCSVCWRYSHFYCLRFLTLWKSIYDVIADTLFASIDVPAN